MRLNLDLTVMGTTNKFLRRRLTAPGRTEKIYIIVHHSGSCEEMGQGEQGRRQKQLGSILVCQG